MNKFEIGDRVAIQKVVGDIGEIAFFGIKEEEVIGATGEVTSIDKSAYPISVMLDKLGETLGFKEEELHKL